MKFLVRCVSVLAIAFCASSAAAWHGPGHKAVALVAYRDPTTPDGLKVKLVEVLKKHPHFDTFLNKDRPAGVDFGEWVVAQAATWPDFVRPKRGHPRPEIDKYHHGEWHYIDLPFVPPGQPELDPAPPDPKAPHVLFALDLNVKKVKSDDTDEMDRAIALCWILHLVGDVHQPLHAAQLFSTDFPAPDGDRGGNYFFVPNSRHAPNLHSYWDSLLGDDESFARIDLVAEKLRHTTRFSRNVLKHELKKKSFKEWADESRAVAVELAYQNGKLQGINIHPSHHLGGTIVPSLTTSYERSAEEAALKRGALAGYRLADLLNQVVGK